MSNLLSKLKLVFDTTKSINFEKFANYFFQEVAAIAIKVSAPNKWNAARIIIIQYDFRNYREVVTTVFKRIAEGKEELEDYGLVELLEVDFYCKHTGVVHFEFSAIQLQLLAEIQPFHTGISINTELGSNWKLTTDKEAVDYYQLYFLSEQEIEPFVKGLWEQHFWYKYQGLLQWEQQPETERKASALVLTIQESLEAYQWDELYKDMLGFVKKEQLYFQEKAITIQHRILCKERFCTELGGDFIETILKAEVDFVLVMELETQQI